MSDSDETGTVVGHLRSGPQRTSGNYPATRLRQRLTVLSSQLAPVGPQAPPGRRCVSLSLGTPRRAGPPYGLPAQATTQGGQFWTPIGGQYSTPVDTRDG